MRTRTFVTTLLALLSALPAHAQSSAQPANEQVVVPEVARRDIMLPRFPSKDWSIALFGGSWSTQNFGSSAVGGIKLGYHLRHQSPCRGRQRIELRLHLSKRGQVPARRAADRAPGGGQAHDLSSPSITTLDNQMAMIERGP